MRTRAHEKQSRRYDAACFIRAVRSVFGLDSAMFPEFSRESERALIPRLGDTEADRETARSDDGSVSLNVTP